MSGRSAEKGNAMPHPKTIESWISRILSPIPPLPATLSPISASLAFPSPTFPRPTRLPFQVRLGLPVVWAVLEQT